MDTAIESAYREPENDEDDIFGDSTQPGATANDEDEEMDLFGEETKPPASTLERLSSPEPSGTREGSEALSASELKHRKDMEYEEDDGQEENVHEVKHALLSIPNLPLPRGTDGKTWVIRMPNYVKLDSRPFSKETYIGPEQSSDSFGERERSMLTKLEVENTVRWRWRKDDYGIDRRQSNSRVIRWSDGSLSLLLGKELFDINQSAESGPRPGASMSQSQTGSLSQSQNAAKLQAHRGAGLSYLVAQHKRSYILQAEAPIAGTMTLRPTGMQSEAHRKLAKAVGQKHSRISRLRMAPDSIAQGQAEAERAEKKVKRSRKSAADRDELGGFGRRKRNTYARRRESVWSDDEEPPEDWADDDEGEFGSPSQRRKTSGEGGRDGGDRAGGDYQTDDFLVADDSEEEGDSSKKKKSRKRRGEEDGDADSLDEIDAKIAEQEARRKRERDAEGHEKADTGRTAERKESEDADVEMDVESEDEDDFTVRRRAGGGKKRVIAIEDDED